MAITNPSNFFYEAQWGLKLINVELAWERLNDHCVATLGIPQGGEDDYTFGNPHLIIGVVDTTGVQSIQNGAAVIPAVRDFQGMVTSNLGGNQDRKTLAFLSEEVDPVTISYLRNNNNTRGSHGTKCAGLLHGKPVVTNIAGFANAFDGVAITGVAPNCRMIATSHSGDNGFVWLFNLIPNRDVGHLLPNAPQIDFVNMIPAFQNHNEGAHIVSMSMSISERHAAMINMMNIFGRNGRGTLFHISAGNAGTTVHSLADFVGNEAKKSFVIGATMFNNSLAEIIAPYSNNGKRVDFAAPSGEDDKNPLGFKNIRSPTTTTRRTGELDALFRLQIDANGFKSGSGKTSVEVTAGADLSAVFPGQHLFCFTSDRGKNFVESRLITAVDRTAATRTVKVITPFSNLAFPGGAVIPMFTTPLVIRLAQVANAGTNTITVSLEDAAYLVGITNVCIANYDAVTHTLLNRQQLVIAPGPNNPNTLTGQVQFTANITNAYQVADTVLIVTETISESSTSVNMIDANSLWISFASVRKFKVGMRVFVFNGSGPSSPVGTVAYIVSIDSANNRIQLGQNKEVDYNNVAASVHVWATGFGDYSFFNGTSAATPVAAGVSALVLSANDSLSLLEVQEVLKLSAEKKTFGAMSGGDWRDENNDKLFSGSSLSGPTTATAQVAVAAIAGATQITVDNAAGFFPNQAIIVGGDTNIIMWVNYTTNVIYLLEPLPAALAVGATVNGGRIFHKHKDVGYGRVDAARAVLVATLYNNNYRDLMIRKTMADDGINAQPATPINSPDIWVVNLPAGYKYASADAKSAVANTDAGYIGAYTTAGDDPVGGKHENPRIDGREKMVYVRIKNRGSHFKSFSDSQVIVSVTFSKTVDAFPTFSYPDAWLGVRSRDETVNAEMTYFLIPAASPVTGVALKTFNGENAHVATLTPFDQSYLPTPVDPGAWTIMKFKWPKEIIPPDNTYRAFIKVQISPFDGEMSDQVMHLNNNLSYKPVMTTGIFLR